MTSPIRQPDDVNPKAFAEVLNLCCSWVIFNLKATGRPRITRPQAAHFMADFIGIPGPHSRTRASVYM